MGLWGQEAFLEGHVYGFERLGGVPVDKIRYDNLNSAVKQVLFTVVARHQRAIGKGAKSLIWTTIWKSCTANPHPESDGRLSSGPTCEMSARLSVTG